jgi:uncharacterized membrane protein
MQKVICHVTKKEYSELEARLGSDIDEPIFEMIRKAHPDFTKNCWISIDELNVFRKQYMENLINDELKELKKLNEDISATLEEGTRRSKRIHELKHEDPTFGQRIADKIAAFGGSWTFILSFLFFLIAWMTVNVLMQDKAYDKYPFILLNLMLSALAALQAPVIMMSQNRQEEKDRRRAEHDYKVNVKAELEIKLLHDKLDYLMISQNKRLLEIQKVQADYLEDILREVQVKDDDVK